MYIDITGPVVYFDCEITGQPRSAYHGAICHNLDVGMLAVVEQEGGDGRPRAAISVIRGAAAEDAVVRGKHEPQLGHNPADTGCRIQQIDLVAGICQIHSRPHAAYARAHDHHRTKHLSLNHTVLLRRSKRIEPLHLARGPKGVLGSGTTQAYRCVRNRFCALGSTRAVQTRLYHARQLPFESTLASARTVVHA